MINDTLYIIGNGFDLHHGIKCRYKDFHEWLEDNYDWDYDDIESCFGDVDLWSDLENNMANFDYERFGSDNVDFSGLMAIVDAQGDTWGFSDAPDNVSEKLKDWHTTMRKRFALWITTLSVTASVNKLDNLNRDAWFLNFNHTHTLEDLYGISPEKILHIHGQVGDTWKCIELGHNGIVEEPTYSLPQMGCTREMTGEEEKAGESARQGVLSWKKDVKRLIEKNHDFWEKLNDVENVYVLGFSFSDVDLPYIKKVASHVSMVAMWHIGWHEVGEDKKFADRAYACGVNMIETFHF